MQQPRRRWTLSVFVILAVLTQLSPLLLWRYSATIWGTGFALDQLFSIAGVLLICVVVGYFWKTRNADADQPLQSNLRPMLVVGGWALVTAHYLMQTSQLSTIGWDFQRYLLAGQNLIQGQTAYVEGYIYPPPLAQVFGALLLLLGRAQEMAHQTPGAAQDYAPLFHLYNYVQAMMIGVAYLLSVRFASRLRIPWNLALLSITLLFLVNTPLMVLLERGQVDLYVLIPLLLALVVSDRYEFLAAFCAGLSLHIKPYAAALSLAWFQQRRWSLLLAMMLGFLALLAASLLHPYGAVSWLEFSNLARHFPIPCKPDDNSLHSLAFGLASLILRDPAAAQKSAQVLYYILAALATAWIVRRLILRGKLARQQDGMSQGRWLLACGQTFDLLALMLMVAPVAWPHHYVLTIPLAIWCLRTGPRRSWYQLALGALLIFAIPKLDVFPLSMNRLAGLLILLAESPLLPAASPPESKCDWAASAADEQE